MRSFLITLALSVSSAAAARLAFTGTPSEVVAGQQYNLTYTLDDPDSPATITLRQGDPANLQTLAIITNNATGTSFQWTPSSSLVNADNYAFQISQSIDNNYSGMFSLSGGAITSSSSSMSSTSTTSSSSPSAMVTGPGLISPASGGVLTNSSGYSNSSITVVAALTNSAGSTTGSTTITTVTNVRLSSNTTMTSNMTMTMTMSGNMTMNGATVTSPTKGSSIAGAAGTSTASSTSATHTSAASAVVYGSSPLALVLCIFAAIMQ